MMCLSRWMLAASVCAAALIGCAPSEPEPSQDAVIIEPAPVIDANSRTFTPPETALVGLDRQVRMRDGVRLNTDIYVPNGGERPVATILIRTPYKTELRKRHQTLLGMGYAIVEQHERGRYLSEGEFTMLPRPAEDGWDTLDWIAAQPWSDGRVATMGCSSSAENQLKLAAQGHPAHTAFIAMSAGVGVGEVGPFREQGNFWRGGVWQQGWFDYFHEAMHQDWPQLPAGLSDEARRRQLARVAVENTGGGVDHARYDETRMHLPMIEIMEELDAPRNEVAEYLTRGPAHPDWAKNRINEGEPIAIPGYWAEAIYDISARSTAAFFNWNRAQNLAEGRDNQSLRLTQGGHCSFGREDDDWSIGDLDLGDARFDFENELIAWLAAWMPVRAETAASPAFTGVRAYTDEAKWTDVSLLPMGGGAVWRLGAEGQFGAEDIGPGALNFTYDPADPVPSLGGEIGGTGSDHDDGSFDQTVLETRDDVLVFTSDALESPTTLLGFAKISLSVSSDQADTDFTVKIMDVYPDGRAFNIGDTILRMRYREGLDEARFMTPGERYDIDLPPILLSRTIEAGHRIKVHVSSSNFPNYARNLNTDQDPYTSTDFAVATNTVHFGSNTATRIEWPAAP